MTVLMDSFEETAYVLRTSLQVSSHTTICPNTYIADGFSDLLVTFLYPPPPQLAQRRGCLTT